MPCLPEDDDKRQKCLLTSGCLLVTGILLTIILVPLSLSSLNYYEYGLIRSTTSGKVSTDDVYTNGRHVLGPTKNFLRYQADAHHLQLDAISVFSAGSSNASVGLSFVLDVSIIYFLKPDELGSLHNQMAGAYESKIRAETEPAIKNRAASVTFDEYFGDRKRVEARLQEAVQDHWTAGQLHCELDHLFLGRIRITDQVAQKQLDSRIQNEINQRQQYLQTAEVERQRTQVQVNSIRLRAAEVLETAKAKADAVRERATTTARRVKADALTNGTRSLFAAVGIEAQEHKTAFTYIRTLQERGADLELSVSYLDPDGVLKTQAVAN